MAEQIPEIYDVGIVGDGQLGRMLTEAAHEMDPPLSVAVLGSDEVSPASLVGAHQLTFESALFSEPGIKQLAALSDVVTWEVEHIDHLQLAVRSTLGAEVQPSPKTLSLIRDKFMQKTMLRAAGIPVADFYDAPSTSTGRLAIHGSVLGQIRAGLMLKKRMGSYDGRGNYPVHSITDLHDGFEALGGQGLYAERMVDLESEYSGEISVIAARGMQNQNIALYDPVDTYHENSICLKTVAPSQHSPELQQQAIELTHDTMNLMRGFGIFAIEMFVTSNGDLLVNEIAPRVHNSGHHTIHSTQTSQFEQHLRAITGRELGSTNLVANHAVMVNILGRSESPDIDWVVPEHHDPRLHVVHYQKSPRVARKIGHITALGDTDERVEDTVTRAEAFREKISV